jgi:ABC-2 type transport system ATP-binding protein
VSGLELVRDLSDKPPSTDGVVIELTINAGPVVAAEALRRLDGAGIMILGLTLREPSLDDVFLELTGHKAEDAIAAAPEPVPAGRRGRS